MSRIVLLFLIALLGLACSKPEKDRDQNDRYSDCLKGFNYEYDKILTRADIVRHLEIDESTLRVDADNKNQSYGSVTYQWASDRPDMELEISGMKLPVPDNNVVRLALLSFYTSESLTLYQHNSYLSLFNTGYRTLSDEEYETLYANLEKEYANDPAGLENAKSLLEQRKKQAYQPVQGVGESAFWVWSEHHGTKLAVLAGAASFYVELKISDDADENLRMAVEIANEILNKCH